VIQSVRWWWLRHAPVEAAAAHRITGQRDVSLAPLDLASLAPLKAALPNEARIVATPLKRTAATLSALGLSPGRLEPAFIEQDFGLWTGKSWEEIPEAEARRFWDRPGETAPPQGESFAAQMARVIPAITLISNENHGQDLLVCAHAGTIRAALAAALDLPADKALGFAIDPLSLTRLDWTPGGWRICWVNRLVTSGKSAC
jgi:alpha-ribazole phosphatase